MNDRIVLSRRALLTAAAALPVIACDSRRPREGFLGRMERFNERVQRGLFRPDHDAPQPQAREQARGDFPVYFISMSLPMAPAGWGLRVGGMVARPSKFTLDDLHRMPRTDMRVQHHCVEGWSAVASWHGVQLREIARIVGADPRAGYIEFRSFDSGYSSSWDRESATHAQTLIAYGRNGVDLPPAYGAPARLYSSVKLGYKNVKYLTEVNFLPRNTGGYWEDLGYEWYAGT